MKLCKVRASCSMIRWCLGGSWGGNIGESSRRLYGSFRKYGDLDIDAKIL